jgi:NAD(P)-dependent dehydrogenase (short-subunit alcohol dehydrogenase family)
LHSGVRRARDLPGAEPFGPPIRVERPATPHPPGATIRVGHQARERSTPMKLHDRVAIVTGAARGIGAATTERLASEGAVVVATDVLDDEGRTLTAAIVEGGCRAEYHHLDVTDEAAWEALVTDVLARHGRIDVVVNNAGIGTLEGVEDETVEGWDRVSAINQKGVWLGMKHAGRAIRESGGGSVVNVSSIFGAVGGFGGSVAYHASKGAVRLMTKNAAIAWSKEGVRVNSVHPGFIDTPMIEQMKGTPVEELIIGGTPVGRLGEPAEVAAVIAFLASDDASYMTGSEVYVDGGWTAQ